MCYIVATIYYANTNKNIDNNTICDGGGSTMKKYNLSIIVCVNAAGTI